MPSKPPAYLGPYQRAVDRHGPGFVSLLFGSREMQTRRFEVLAGCVSLAGRHLADLGSGHGDLATWLRAHEVDLAAYVGVEALPLFDQRARQQATREGLADTRFVCADFVSTPDLFETLVAQGVDTMMFCGSLNTLDERTALAVLERAWRALSGCERGVLAFNFLSGDERWPRPSTNLPRRPTREWLDWALAHTPEVMFCQHYLGAHDATIAMVHPAQAE